MCEIREITESNFYENMINTQKHLNIKNPSNYGI